MIRIDQIAASVLRLVARAAGLVAGSATVVGLAFVLRPSTFAVGQIPKPEKSEARPAGSPNLGDKDFEFATKIRLLQGQAKLTLESEDLTAELSRRQVANQVVFTAAIQNGFTITGDEDLDKVNHLLTSNGRFPWTLSVNDDLGFLKHLKELYRNSFGPRVLNGVSINRLTIPLVSRDFTDCVAILTDQDEWFASGILIDKDLVLTAGHVLDKMPNYRQDPKLKVYVGLDANHLEDRDRLFNVVACQRPETYRRFDIGLRPTSVDDIAILLLDRPVPGKQASPVELAPASLIDRMGDIYVAGFGPTGRTLPDDDTRFIKGIKNVGQVAISGCDCSGQVNGKSRESSYGCNPGKEFVALDLRHIPLHERTDPAMGDSGGPAYVRSDDGRLLLAGVISRSVVLTDAMIEIAIDAANQGHVGPIGVRAGFGGIYVRVDKYAEFIDKSRAEFRNRPQNKPKPH